MGSGMSKFLSNLGPQPQTTTMTFNDASSLVTNVIQSTTQSCITSDVGGNSIIVDGNYNVLDNISQSLTFTVNQNCSALVEDPDDFSTTIANAINQQMTQSASNLTSFLSNKLTSSRSPKSI